MSPPPPVLLALSDTLHAARHGSRRTNGGRGGEGSKKNMLRFYTDESPGLTVSPVLVLSMSLGFVAFVVLLHVIGKLYSLRM